VAYCLA